MANETQKPTTEEKGPKEQAPQPQTQIGGMAEQTPVKPDKKTIEQPTHEFELKVGDVVISKGGKTIKTTKQNFTTVYMGHGWEIVDEKTKASQKKS